MKIASITMPKHSRQYYTSKIKKFPKGNICWMCPWSKFNPMPGAWLNGMVVWCKMARRWGYPIKVCELMPGLDLEYYNATRTGRVVTSGEYIAWVRSSVL